MADRKQILTTCKSCHGGCGVIVTVEDGVIVHIQGNPDSLTGGTMCSKGVSSIQHIDNPYRIKYPMKQVGPKGEGKWKRISWDEALDTVASKMKDAIKDPGPHSIAVSQGTGRGYNRYTMKLARSLGTGNAITPGYVCHSPRLGLYGLVTGYGRLYCDYHGWGGEFPKTQIMWAKQLEISSADSEMAYWFMNSLDYCKNLIIIDPRATAYASRATLWIQPRVGTDCALAMGMMNVIYEEELWDKEFCDDWTFGFDELRERVKDFTPEKVSDICWIPREHVTEAARMWAVDTPGCIQVGSSLERQANCGHTLRAITCLMGLAGNIERPGSMITWVLPETGLIEDFFLELPITDEMKSKIIGGDTYKMGAARTCNPDTMVKAINAGKSPIKVWFSVGGQQIVHMANTNEVVAAIEKVDFMCHTDLFMGPMAEAADIVLPAAHWLELDDVYDMHPRFMIEAHNKVVDPPGEAKADAWIFNEVGKRVVPDKWFEDVESMLDYQVRKGKNGAMTWKDFSKQLVSGCYGPRPGVLQVQDRLLAQGWRVPDPEQEVRVPLEPSRVARVRPAACVRRAGREPGLDAGAVRGVPAHHEHGLPAALLLPRPVPQHPLAAQLHGVPAVPAAPGDGGQVRRRGRRYRLDRVAAGPRAPEVARLPGDQEGHAHGHGQLLLSGGAGEGLSRGVHQQPERPHEQRPPRPDVRLPRHDVPSLQGLQGHRRGAHGRGVPHGGLRHRARS